MTLDHRIWLLGATDFGIAGAVLVWKQNPGIGIAAILTGAVALVHLWITIASRPGPRDETPPEAKPETPVDVAAGIELLGKELHKHFGDNEARYRDVTKQYVTIAGVSLALLGALHKEADTSLEIPVGASSLGVSIAVGLILLERLSGSTSVSVTFGRYAITIMYHLMSWSLLFGLLSILASVWRT